MNKRRFSLFLVVCIAIPCWADADLTRGVGHLESGEIDKAQSILEAIATAQPDNAEAAYQTGRTYQQQGDMKGAIRWFERATELDENNSMYFLKLGEARGTLAGEVGMFKAMRMAGKVKSAFEKAVALDPDNIDARSGLVTYYLNAPGMAGGSTDKAFEQAEEIAKRDALRGHFSRAQVYDKKGDADNTEREYRAAIALGAEDHDPYLALGIFLTDQKRYADAMATYDQWLEKHPDDLSVTYQVGRTASIGGDFLERGQKAFEKYLAGKPTIDMPSHAWAHYRLGLIHNYQGQKPAARAAFEQALTLEPKHKEAKRALKKL